ncbi:hypothetical protein AWC19_27245 [Mycobacterium palustre]|uniref:Uncharacterized protein n=1 Tax=Mycobacterium palustre TaxID=153971 RepID=A0A1X1ZVS7_9MYCO|nr:hypothetical protein AWC19_27245 [Mycobacterium palustre]
MGIELLREQDYGARERRTNCSLKHPCRSTAGVDTEGQKAGVKERVLAGNADVAGQREIEAGAHGGAVDRCDGWQSAIGDGKEPRIQLA